VQRRERFRRNAIRMTVLALMFLPILMGGDSDCEDDWSSGDTFSLVELIIDGILAIIDATR
jgi:hypothetical protein